MSLPQEATAKPVYDTDNMGAYTGQLVHADLVHQLPAAQEKASWPNVIDRLNWATYQTGALGLSGVESAILKHVCFVSGTVKGCFQHQDTMVQETGWNHSTVSRTLAALTTKGLLEANRRGIGRTTVYYLVGLATMPASAQSDSAQSDIKPAQRATPDSAQSDVGQRTERQHNRNSNLKGLTSLNQPSSSGLVGRDAVDDDDDGDLSISGVTDPGPGAGLTIQEVRAEVERFPEWLSRLRNPIGFYIAMAAKPDAFREQVQEHDAEAQAVAERLERAEAEIEPWEPQPAKPLAPMLFQQPATFAKFQELWERGHLSLDRDWAAKQKEIHRGATFAEVGGYERWYDANIAPWKLPDDVDEVPPGPVDARSEDAKRWQSTRKAIINLGLNTVPQLWAIMPRDVPAIEGDTMRLTFRTAGIKRAFDEIYSEHAGAILDVITFDWPGVTHLETTVSTEN